MVVLMFKQVWIFLIIFLLFSTSITAQECPVESNRGDLNNITNVKQVIQEWITSLSPNKDSVILVYYPTTSEVEYQPYETIFGKREILKRCFECEDIHIEFPEDFSKKTGTFEAYQGVDSILARKNLKKKYNNVVGFISMVVDYSIGVPGETNQLRQQRLGLKLYNTENEDCLKSASFYATAEPPTEKAIHYPLLVGFAHFPLFPKNSEKKEKANLHSAFMVSFGQQIHQNWKNFPFYLESKITVLGSRAPLFGDLNDHLSKADEEGVEKKIGDIGGILFGGNIGLQSNGSYRFGGYGGPGIALIPVIDNMLFLTLGTHFQTGSFLFEIQVVGAANEKLENGLFWLMQGGWVF